MPIPDFKIGFSRDPVWNTSKYPLL